LPDFVLVDAFRVPDLPMASVAVVLGDARCTAIAAASIVAKVTRDRMMISCHSRDPRYGFDRTKGYATRDHLDAGLALRLLGSPPTFVPASVPV
jgi:ribonuclease HII